VYFGGGTPSILGIKDFEKIFEKLSSYINLETEITIEANPSSWHEEKAKALIAMGANRLSIGIQSLNDEKLSFLSRVHDKKIAFIAYDASIKAGFENISVDFMYDTKFDDEDFLRREIDAFLALSPTHLSAYSLTIEEDTPFERKGVKSRYDENAARLVAQSFIAAGFEHYEVASFGKKRSKHNFGYWEYKPYIGVGAGAVGFDGAKRYAPLKSIEEYIKEPLKKEYEELSVKDIRVEKILLGLRSKVGVDAAAINDKEMLQALINDGLVSIDNGVIYCNDFFLADEIATRLS
jgi:oxygen-independent coproporphyrinogen-3 oxidase